MTCKTVFTLSSSLALIALLTHISAARANFTDNFSGGLSHWTTWSSQKLGHGSTSATSSSKGAKLTAAVTSTASGADKSPYVYLVGKAAAEADFFNKPVTLTVNGLYVGNSTQPHPYYTYTEIGFVSKPTYATYQASAFGLWFKGNGQVYLGWKDNANGMVPTAQTSPVNSDGTMGKNPYGIIVGLTTGLSPTKTPFDVILTLGPTNGGTQLSYNLKLKYTGTDSLDTNHNGYIDSGDKGMSQLSGTLSAAKTSELKTAWIKASSKGNTVALPYISARANLLPAVGDHSVVTVSSVSVATATAAPR